LSTPSRHVAGGGGGESSTMSIVIRRLSQPLPTH
jgi:hypothetical protein